MSPLSYIIGPFIRWKRRLYDDRIEARAQLLASMALAQIEQERLEQEWAKYGMTKEEYEERKMLAAAWMPFNPRKLTKGQVKALTFFDDIQLSAMQTVADELRAELSNRALRSDGNERDKPMWVAVGVQLLADTVREKIKTYGGQKEREEQKASNKAKNEPKENKRSMQNLYENRIIRQ